MSNSEESSEENPFWREDRGRETPDQALDRSVRSLFEKTKERMVAHHNRPTENVHTNTQE